MGFKGGKNNKAQAKGDMSLKEILAKRGTGELDVGCLELYLSPIDFQQLFGTSLAEFQKLPKWKQETAKRKHKLY